MKLKEGKGSQEKVYGTQLRFLAVGKRTNLLVLLVLPKLSSDLWILIQRSIHPLQCV